MRLVGIPSRWSRSRLAIRRHPPGLGENTAEVLRDLGFKKDTIARLAADGAIGGVATTSADPLRRRHTARKPRSR